MLLPVHDNNDDDDVVRYKNSCYKYELQDKHKNRKLCYVAISISLSLSSSPSPFALHKPPAKKKTRSLKALCSFVANYKISDKNCIKLPDVPPSQCVCVCVYILNTYEYFIHYLIAC